MATGKTLDVHGMDCPGCENRVQTALTRLEGVIRVDADHRTGRVTVRFDEARLSVDDVNERIRDAGYEVV